MKIHNTSKFLIILLSTLTKTTTSQQPNPHLNYATARCSYSEPINTNTTYHNNILTALSNLHSLSSVNHFFTTTTGLSPDEVNAFYLCRPDLPLSTCHDCVNATINTFQQLCFNRKETIIWYQECMIRYTNNTIFPSGNETERWNYVYSPFNVSDPRTFLQVVNTTIRELISRAVFPNNTPRYFVYGQANFTVFEEFYGMVLCRPDMSPDDCESCLMTALGRISSCCGNSVAVSTLFFFPNCQLRYDTAPFIFPSQQPFSPSPL